MSYSNEEMKAICLGLAEKAEPLEAEALRSVAETYGSAPEKPERFELKFRHIAIALAFTYAIMTPAYFLWGYGYVPPVDPTGAAIEQIMDLQRVDGGRYASRTFKFAYSQTYQTDPVPLVVYEDLTPLPASNYELQQLSPVNLTRTVTIKTSDGTSPVTNGRRYFVVLPDKD